jgi:hypothetical protein
MKHDFADGKYTVINDNGKLTALRHGEPWSRDLTGDNLIYWMLVEVDRLKDEVRQLQGLACTAVCQALDLANGWPERELCQPIADTFSTLDKLVPNHDVERPTGAERADRAQALLDAARKEITK